MTNAAALRALADQLEQDETAIYKSLRQADPKGLAIKMLRDAANELLGWDESLMELVQLYRSRWLSCVTQEEAQRLREEIERVGFKRDLYHEWWRAICDVELEGRREIARLRGEVSRLTPSPAEQAQREEIGTHTPDVMPEGEGITGTHLKRCPFCGYDDIEWKGYLSNSMLRCVGCGVITDDGSRERVVALWNRRAFEPTQAELAQRKLNDDAWERNKDIRLGTDRGQG